MISILGVGRLLQTIREAHQPITVTRLHLQSCQSGVLKQLRRTRVSSREHYHLRDPARIAAVITRARSQIAGRKTALAIAKDGAVLVADDTNGTIRRIAYIRKQ